VNRTKIEWTDATLNPVVGCTHGCEYCYARKQAKRQKQRCQLCYKFIPHPHLPRLDKLNPNQMPKKVFLDSMWDWNDRGVRIEWLHPILDTVKKCPQHTFQILSKKPKGYGRFSFPPNVWLGTSIGTNMDVHRVRELGNAVGSGNIKFISIEPIHGRLDFWFTLEITDWLVIGAETGHRKGKIAPKKEWIDRIIENAHSEHIPIFIKDNLFWHRRIQEIPESQLSKQNV
jgi:protein gp37